MGLVRGTVSTSSSYSSNIPSAFLVITSSMVTSYPMNAPAMTRSPFSKVKSEYSSDIEFSSTRASPVVSVASVFLSSMSSQMYLGEAAQKNANISAATSTSTLITYTTTAAHKITVGQRVSLSNVTPVNYNFTAAEVLEVTSTTFKIKNQTGSVLPSYVSGGSALAVGTGYIVHRWGLEIFGGIPNDILTVTYTGGLNGNNIATMKLMILRAATREMQNMHDDVVGVKDLNPRSVAVAETGFLEKELSVLKSFRRRRIS